MSGTIAVFTSDRVASKWLAIYGKPYGGIPVSRWTGWTPTDNGERGFLLLSDEQSEPRDDQANAFSAFDPGREKLAVLRTEPGRVIAFLPRQFYSGTWSLSKPMPEKEAQANPLPALRRCAEHDARAQGKEVPALLQLPRGVLSGREQGGSSHPAEPESFPPVHDLLLRLLRDESVHERQSLPKLQKAHRLESRLSDRKGGKAS